MPKMSVIILDKKMRTVFASHIAPPLTAASVLGSVPWDEKFIDRAGGERLRKAWEAAEASGSGFVDSVSKHIGTWRTHFFPVANKSVPLVRAVWIIYRLPPALGKLTPRELEIARHIARGKSAKEIARLLKMTTSTVGSHRAKIARKLGVSSGGLDLYVGTFAGAFR